MITLDRLSKSFRGHGQETVVAQALSFAFPTGRATAVIGRNGAGKSSLLRLIAGILPPDDGRVLRQGSVSWPVGFQGSFHPDLTGAENARFVARIHDLPPAAMVRFVEDFTELGQHLHRPLRHYSSGMRARLAFALSMAVPFDSYLIDEVTAVGDGAFNRKSQSYLADRLRGASAIVVSHSMDYLRATCQSGAVLEKGRLFYYERVERAIEHHQHLLCGRLPPWLN